MIEILASGPRCTVQDVGRTGYAYLGVPRSGAFDRAALALANRLVGNPAAAAGLEITLGGLEIAVHDAVTLALTGARCAGLDYGAAVTLRPGTRVWLARPTTGLRSYLAVRGGLAVPAELGSRSTDTLSGLGPAPPRKGDQLAVGPEPADDVADVLVPEPVCPAALRVIPGPRADWFTSEALTRLLSTAWIVRPESDRIGVRLDVGSDAAADIEARTRSGIEPRDEPPLPRARAGELPSEPTLPGALQVPPDGRPILLGPDAPVTGGYPVIAVVRDGDLGAAAQLRPGDLVRFAAL